MCAVFWEEILVIWWLVLVVYPKTWLIQYQKLLALIQELLDHHHLFDLDESVVLVCYRELKGVIWYFH